MSEQVKIFVRGAPGLHRTLVPEGAPATGLREIASKTHPQGPSLELAFESCDGVATFRNALAEGPQGSSGVFAFEPNIVVLSIESDLRGSIGEWGPAEADQFQSDLIEVVHLIKERLGSHIIVLNASSVDPAGKVASYSGLEHEPSELRAHRYNLAVMHVSFQEGISVVDVDRLIAELGAQQAVSRFLEYAPEAATSVCNELVRVIGDYGFLDNRPLLPQVGRDAAS